MSDDTPVRSPLQESGVLGGELKPLLAAAPLCLTAFVLAYRPVAGANTQEFLGAVLFAMLLLGALCLWLCGGVLSGAIRWRAGRESLVFLAFLVAAAVSCTRAHDGLAAVRAWWPFATYGLTGFMVLQLCDGGVRRRLMLSCLLATMAMVAVFGLIHLAIYLPALHRWILNEPQRFEMLFDIQPGAFEDLRIRVAGKRAVGHFLTSNQLAGFVMPGLFIVGGALAGGLGWLKSRKGGAAALAGGIALAAALAGALVATGSKGALVCAVIGAGVFALGWLRNGGRGRLRHVAVAAAIGVLVVGALLGFARQFRPSGFRRSLGVRLGYWQTSMQMVRQHPVLGVGPGCWEEHHMILKSPLHGETRMAHNAYVQIWAENGTVGLGLFAAFVVLVAVRALGPRTDSARPLTGEARASPASGAPYARMGLCIGAAALLLDYVFVGTFRPPERYVPGFMQIAPWLVYLVLYGVWAAVFGLLHRGFGRADRAVPLLADTGLARLGLLSALAAFLVQSAGEMTLRIPALGATAFALAAVALADRLPVRERRMPPGAVAAALVLLALLPPLLLSTVVCGRVWDYTSALDDAFRLKGELSRSEDRRKTMGEIVEAYRGATASLPWDDDSWQELGRQAYYAAMVTRDPRQRAELLGEAEKACRRAIALNPLRAKNERMLAELLDGTGRAGEAVEHLARATELHPSVPISWFDYAQGIERVHGLTPEACAAYRKAAQLSVRKRGPDGAVIEGQYHKRNVFEGQRKRQLARKLSACSRR